jgi:L-threonylcarbamoyladenylate synthase
MDIWKLENNVSEVAEYAAEALHAGGVILYPTDTLYGLGADAFSDAAVDKVYAIKGRDPHKPIHAVFANTDMIEDYAEVNDIGRALMDAFLPGPLTIVFRKRSGIETGIARGIETVGVRIPDNIFCVSTANAFGRPFTTTSANLAGNVTGRTIPEILAQLGTSQNYIDVTIDAGELPKREPSTVVDVSSGAPVILREGAILASEIRKVLH